MPPWPVSFTCCSKGALVGSLLVRLFGQLFTLVRSSPLLYPISLSLAQDALFKLSISSIVKFAQSNAEQSSKTTGTWPLLSPSLVFSSVAIYCRADRC
jgi:hypothetical protein